MSCPLFDATEIIDMGSILISEEHVWPYAQPTDWENREEGQICSSHESVDGPHLLRESVCAFAKQNKVFLFFFLATIIPVLLTLCLDQVLLVVVAPVVILLAAAYSCAVPTLSMTFGAQCDFY